AEGDDPGRLRDRGPRRSSGEDPGVLRGAITGAEVDRSAGRDGEVGGGRRNRTARGLPRVERELDELSLRGHSGAVEQEQHVVAGRGDAPVGRAREAERAAPARSVARGLRRGAAK